MRLISRIVFVNKSISSTSRPDSSATRSIVRDQFGLTMTPEHSSMIQTQSDSTRSRLGGAQWKTSLHGHVVKHLLKPTRADHQKKCFVVQALLMYMRSFSRPMWPDMALRNQST